MFRDWKSFEMHVRNMDVSAILIWFQMQMRNIIGKVGKGNPCYKMAKNSAEQCSRI